MLAKCVQILEKKKPPLTKELIKKYIPEKYHNEKHAHLTQHYWATAEAQYDLSMLEEWMTPNITGCYFHCWKETPKDITECKRLCDLDKLDIVCKNAHK